MMSETFYLGISFKSFCGFSEVKDIEAKETEVKGTKIEETKVKDYEYDALNYLQREFDILSNEEIIKHVKEIYDDLDSSFYDSRIDQVVDRISFIYDLPITQKIVAEDYFSKIIRKISSINKNIIPLEDIYEKFRIIKLNNKTNILSEHIDTIMNTLKEKINDEEINEMNICLNEYTCEKFNKYLDKKMFEHKSLDYIIEILPNIDKFISCINNSEIKDIRNLYSKLDQLKDYNYEPNPYDKAKYIKKVLIKKLHNIEIRDYNGKQYIDGIIKLLS